MSVSEVNNYLPVMEDKNLFEPVGKSKLDQYDFMNLFITELQHQDPMEPMSTEAMAGQLADFSNMEATMTMSDNMEKLLEYQVSQSNLQLLTLIDADVMVAGNTLGVNQDGPTGKGSFSMLGEAGTTVVEIYDAGGRMVDVVDMGNLAIGTYDLEWDGNDMQGDPVEDGAYTFLVKGFDGAGQEVDVDYRVSGKVTGLDFGTGAALLKLDNYVEADVGSVVSVL